MSLLLIKRHAYTHLLRITLFYLLILSFLKVFLDRVLLTLVLKHNSYEEYTKLIFKSCSMPSLAQILQ